MKKHLTVCLLVLAFSPAVCQQTSAHNLFWFRLALSDTMSAKMRWELFLQQRTQNNFPGHTNFFASPQFKSYWLWLHYSFNKNVKAAVSPFGYFESYVLNNSPTDALLPPIREFRFCLRLEHETKGSFVNYINRYNVEYRLRDLDHNRIFQPNIRVRYMIRLEVPVKGLLSQSKPVVFAVYDEIFLQFGGAMKQKPNIFDQNRISVGAGYEVFRNIKVNLAYIYGYQERNSGIEFDTINTLWLTLTFDNVVSQLFARNKNSE